MSDPKESPEQADASPETPLNETTPQMDSQQKSAESSDLETLDETTAEVRRVLGSEEPPSRRRG